MLPDDIVVDILKLIIGVMLGSFLGSLIGMWVFKRAVTRMLADRQLMEEVEKRLSDLIRNIMKRAISG